MKGEGSTLLCLQLTGDSEEYQSKIVKSYLSSSTYAADFFNLNWGKCENAGFSKLYTPETPIIGTNTASGNYYN